MHSVLLSSSLCLDTHPTNQGCEFTNELNKPLDLSEPGWHVAATECIYDADFWQNIRTSFSKTTIEINNLETMVMHDNALITGMQ